MFAKIFDGFSIGWEIFKSSLRFMLKNPFTLVPILMGGGAFLGVVYWGITTYDISEFTNTEALIALFVYTSAFTVCISISSLVLLELLEQKETKGRMNIFTAIFDALVRDLIRAIPLILFWSVVKFLLLLLELAIAAANSRENGNRTYRSRRRERRTSRWIDTLKTGTRMGVMISLSAIAWEPVGPFKAMKKGLKVYKSHFATMVAGIGLSKILKLIVFLPGIVILLIAFQFPVVPDAVLYGVVIYTGIAWAIGIMMEQLYTAELYMWYMMYEKEVEEGQVTGNIPKNMMEVKKPSFLDETPDFAVKGIYMGPERY